MNPSNGYCMTFPMFDYCQRLNIRGFGRREYITEIIAMFNVQNAITASLAVNQSSRVLQFVVLVSRGDTVVPGLKLTAFAHIVCT